MAMKYVKLFEHWLNEDEGQEKERKPFNPEKPSLTNVLLIKTDDVTKNPNSDSKILKSIVERIASKYGEKDISVNFYKFYMGEPDYKNGLFPLYKNQEKASASIIWKPFSLQTDVKGSIPFGSGKGPQGPKGDFYLETYIIPLKETFVTKSATAQESSPDMLVNDDVLIIAPSDKKSQMALNSKWWLWNHKKREWELVSLGQLSMFAHSDFKDESILKDPSKGSMKSIAGFLEETDTYNKFAPEIEEPES